VIRSAKKRRMGAYMRMGEKINSSEMIGESLEENKIF
jgi:hypothetical protein